MAEKILEIREVTFKIGDGYYGNYEGFEVVTDKQVIKLAIDADGQCCESWGYFMTNDNIEDFIGADLLEVKVVDESLKVKTLEESDGYSEEYTMFVNIETSKGTLQFTAYNEHNGYYSHEAVVISEQLNHSEYI